MGLVVSVGDLVKNLATAQYRFELGGGLFDRTAIIGVGRHNGVILHCKVGFVHKNVQDFEGTRPFVVHLGAVSLFRGDGFNVVKLSVTWTGLAGLHSTFVLVELWWANFGLYKTG